MPSKDILDIHPEVHAALEEHRGVVALESTIISHGMPFPKNVETAKAVEDEVRQAGAVPATIALMDGKFKVGLSPEELQRLGTEGRKVIKCSRRDLPFVLDRRATGATTVAATMIIARMSGVRLFATGGIGGVHRGATDTMDISADLQELARTDVAVVSAGAKAILDIGLTLEYLETQGVPVIGYQTDEFPAFYTRRSGYGVDYRYDDPASLARALLFKWRVGIGGGVLIANPIPASDEMEYAEVQKAIEQALAEADRQNIRGKKITPFLLARIEQLTKGASLSANIELVLNNARLAGALAVHMVE